MERIWSDSNAKQQARAVFILPFGIYPGHMQVGIEIQIRNIPVKQSTIEICERYDLNPYRLLSDGCVVFVADNGGQFCEVLKKQGIPAGSHWKGKSWNQAGNLSGREPRDFWIVRKRMS